MRIKQENINLTELSANKEKYINTLHMEWKNKEDQLIAKINELQSKLEMSVINNNEMTLRCDKLEKDILEMVKLFLTSYYLELKE
jgi:hypothetical protein